MTSFKIILVWAYYLRNVLVIHTKAILSKMVGKTGMSKGEIWGEMYYFIASGEFL